MEEESRGAAKAKQQEKEVAGEESDGAAVVLDLDAGDPVFDLEKAVCSHGLFMMAPNRWDPSTKTLQRPLRLSPLSSLTVRVSHPHPRPSPLAVSVFGVRSLSLRQKETILAQVRRMLRISEEEHRMIRDFHEIHPGAKETGFGRIFRSPTLFEDMVKCILLCNCQWSRSLSMARSLCELQLEIKEGTDSLDFHPKTPQKRELKRMISKKRKVALNLENKFGFDESLVLADISTPNNQCAFTELCDNKKTNSGSSSLIRDPRDMPDSVELQNGCEVDEFCSTYKLSEPSSQIGDFPSPEELASLSGELLAKRCRLGYRAKRILSLAQNITEKNLRLEELEEACNVSMPSSYETLAQQLLLVNGFGPFTCANVLMCMGFYHKIPSDSETLRHLEQIHSRSCNIRTVEKILEEIYGKYAPFQFLAYWSELWEFYEKWFGKTSEMPCSDYQRITASNMKVKKSICTLNGRKKGKVKA